MLTGRSLFAGDTVTDTLAGVLKTEIDFSKLPGSTPRPVRRLLRRCLQRSPRNRLHDIADARIVLDEVIAGDLDEEATRVPVPQRSRLSRALPWVLVALLASRSEVSTEAPFVSGLFAGAYGENAKAGVYATPIWG